MSDVVFASNLFSVEEQKKIYDTVFEIQPSFYVPETRWGKKMNLKMNCLGKHWNAKTYRYERERNDFDKLPVAPIPEYFRSLITKILDSTGYWPEDRFDYDICICNWYEENGKLGIHQDNSESKSSLAYGYPVISLSIGDDCEFLIGGLQRTDPTTKHVLKSGDVVLFGHSKRLAFHGVTKLFPGTKPAELDIPSGRLNLTFRIY